VGDEMERNEMGGTCGTIGNRIGAYRVLVGGGLRARDIWVDKT
jgi:hypothetical protein